MNDKVTVPDDILEAAMRAVNAEPNGVSMACVQIACRAIMAERERCADICNGWLEQHGSRPIAHVSAAEYASDAVKDILELIVADPAVVQESELLSIIERTA